jgi:hypothetical protein
MSAHPAGCVCVECEDRARAAQFWLQLVALWGSEEVDGYNEGGKNGLISRVGALVEEWQRFKVPSLQGLSATESQQIVDFVKARVAGARRIRRDRLCTYSWVASPPAASDSQVIGRPATFGRHSRDRTMPTARSA